MKQRRTILGALDYSIAYLQGLRKGLMDHGSPNQELQWAISGMIIAPTCNLIQTFEKVIRDSLESGESNATNDLKQVQAEFNSYIEKMIETQN